MTNQLWIYDTTLRDGAQCEGLSLSLEDKLRIARQLDSLGIPFIEGGWPGANPKDVQFFWRLKEQPLTQAEVVAFCSTRRPGKAAADDEMLQAILSAGTRWVTLFGKSWDLHVIEGLKTTLDENLAMIRDTVEFFRSQGRRVIYDAEHWFDGYKHNRDYAIETLKAAADAGAEWLVLCDTNGGTLPHEVSQVVRDVAGTIESWEISDSEIHPPQPPLVKGGRTVAESSVASEIDPPQPPLVKGGQEVSQMLQNSLFKAGKKSQIQLGIHTHNDAGVAVANALAAVQEGVTMVQGTINGYGERCGNANLCSLIPNFQLKLGYDCIQDEQLKKLTQVSRSVSEIVNLAPDDRAPFVGLSAFAHKGGIHVSAVEKNPLTYEHMEPEKIGNCRRIVISDQAGLSNVLAKARTFGIELDRKDPACRQILEKLKKLESQGYQFEAAEASFELLMRSALQQRQPWFEITGFQVHCDKVGEDCTALATVKLSVNGTNILEAAEGNGPVSALDAALRKALVNFYPAIAHFYLTDYKVRILDGGAGTSAKTRVLVEFSNGQDRWTTVGVSGNILDASCQAVVEGLEYGLVLENQEAIALVCRVH